jgi:hypothetical protein
VLGHSFGGLCALGAALLTRNICRLVLYEPDAPVAGGSGLPAGVIQRLQALLDAGDRERVYTVFLRDVAQLPPDEIELLRSSPTWPARVTEAHTLPRELQQHLAMYTAPELFVREVVAFLSEEG